MWLVSLLKASKPGSLRTLCITFLQVDGSMHTSLQVCTWSMDRLSEKGHHLGLFALKVLWQAECWGPITLINQLQQDLKVTEDWNRDSGFLYSRLFAPNSWLRTNNVWRMVRAEDRFNGTNTTVAKVNSLTLKNTTGKLKKMSNAKLIE